MANMQTHSTGRYAFLRALTTEQLEQLLKADYSASMPEDAAEEFIDAVIEVMLEKEKEAPSGRLVDVDKAWADFQTYYNVPDRDGQLLYPDPLSPDPAPSQKAPVRRPRRVLRPVALVAAAIGVFMSLLVVAQAAGLDVFGAMARWTDETFHFVTTSAGDETAALRAALEEQGIPASYAPTWLPAGFKAEEPQVIRTKNFTAVSLQLSNEGKKLVLVFTCYRSEGAIQAFSYEKGMGEAIPYTSGDRLFYMFENQGTTVALWSDGERLSIDIHGEISTDDMKSILDSIGG